jgi:UDP-glucose 4-epimerase
MSPTILVTGSSGTVGTALTLALRECKFDVIPLDIKSSLWDADIDRRTVRHDLRKPLTSIRLKKLPDVIIHLAANARVHESVSHPEMARDNYLMTFNVLEYARSKGIRRILFSSSREIYGESGPGERRGENSVSIDGMKSPYTASKYGVEALLRSYAECFDIQSVVVRLSNVYGKYDVSERVIPLFIYHALRNHDLTVFGAHKKLDFTYIEDCVNALLQIVRRIDKVSGETFNICTGHGCKLIDLAKDVIRLLNSHSKIRIDNKRSGEITSFVGDIALARKKLGYNPQVDIQKGLPLAIEWYLDAMKDRRVYFTQRRILKRLGWL